MGQSFLDIFKQYFSNLPENKILSGNKNNIDIPFSWVFTEKLDKAIIQKALASIFMKNNKFYKNTSFFKHKTPDAIDSFSIQFNKYNGSISLLVMGADDWSKLLITDHPNEFSKLLQITSEEFNKAITAILNEERLSKIVSLDLNLTPDANNYVQSVFAKALNSPQVANSTAIAMCDMATNLTQYYDYLISLRDDPIVYYGGIIKQRQDDGKGKVRNLGLGARLRKSPIYPFTERSSIYESLNPDSKIVYGTVGEDDKVEKNAYITYVFSKPRDYDGHLFVCEPLEGSRDTRMFYIPAEAFDSYTVDDSNNKMVELAKKYIEMSKKEFQDERYTKVFIHNNIDSFKDRILYMITGKTTPTVARRPGLYSQYDEQLFSGTVITPSDFQDAIQDVTLQDIDNAAKIFTSLDLEHSAEHNSQLGGD